MNYDVLVVGAGPAGLSAALVLGRARRTVLVCDTGRYRNAASRAMHGYLTRDGIAPTELLRIGREELAQYESVELRRVEVLDVKRVKNGYTAKLADGTRVRVRKTLLATGIVDNVPEIEGIDELYGRSVYHCPYCDGWEVRDAPIAVYGRGKRGLGLAFELTAWSKDLVLLTDGPPNLGRRERERLAANGIGLVPSTISRLEGREGILERVVFASGDSIARRALFFSTGQTQRSDLAERLGCEFTSKGAIRTGKHESTCVPGLYVAGDASRNVQWVVVAAAEGAEAAFAINTALLEEDLK